MGRVLTNVLQKSGRSEGSTLGEGGSGRASNSNAGDGGSNTEKGGHCRLSSCIMMDRKKEKGKRRKKKKVKKLAVKEKAAEIRQNISQMVGWLVCRRLGIWDLSVKIHGF